MDLDQIKRKALDFFVVTEDNGQWVPWADACKFALECVEQAQAEQTEKDNDDGK
jgi:hypothetical protein